MGFTTNVFENMGMLQFGKNVLRYLIFLGIYRSTYFSFSRNIISLLYFSIGAIIDGSIFCVHGGLSPDIKNIDQVVLYILFSKIGTRAEPISRDPP